MFDLFVSQWLGMYLFDNKTHVSVRGFAQFQDSFFFFFFEWNAKTSALLFGSVLELCIKVALGTKHNANHHNPYIHLYILFFFLLPNCIEHFLECPQRRPFNHFFPWEWEMYCAKRYAVLSWTHASLINIYLLYAIYTNLMVSCERDPPNRIGHFRL